MLPWTRRSFLRRLALAVPVARAGTSRRLVLTAPVVSTPAAVAQRGAAATGAAATGAAAAPIFTFEADEIWLNLHHFLYVLGRAERGAPDSRRQAVSGAPAEAARGLAALSEADRRVWREAVTAYAGGHSRQDVLLDQPLLAVTAALARVDEAVTLAGARSEVDAETRATLERAAPVYRRGWWPAHRDGNRAWRIGVQPLIERHGETILAFITRAYQLRWPAAGYPVHLSAFTNWAGAYSTGGGLLMVATSGAAGRPDLLALEAVFHEGMHQWDEAITAAIRVQERRLGQKAPDLLWHALIFYTAGEAVRQVAPDHVPYAQANGVWDRGMGRMKPALDAVWKPYLDGRGGARDEALAALVERTARP